MAHREWIGGRVLTLLSHYWRDDDPVELTAAIGADWADVLSGMPQEYIQRACIQYQKDEPRRKPTPGALYQVTQGLMQAAIRMAEPENPPQPERLSVFEMDDEQIKQRRSEAAAIMAGFSKGA